MVKEHVEASTLAISALLKESHLVTHSADLQRVALLGHMTQMLVHEINHHLTPIAMAVSSLREHCVAVQRALDEPNPDHDPTQMANEIGEAIDILRLLDNNVQGLTDKSRLFGRMMVHDALEVNRVDRIIERSLDLVRDQAADAHIALTYAPPDHLLFTRLRATQVQQVVLNTLLNAIQQIERLRPDGGGRVDIRIEAVTLEREPVIQIQIEDDGPGIHRRLWERVFELGFTTRVGEGSGLGLFLSRQLLADVGGSIRVAESRIQWGTVMEIRLPISLTEMSTA
jgi:signal transduction histidine kinase